ncbi:endogenous retrovirus group K member 6 Pro protein-like [Cricetulus griseus]|uniref:Endogenous retrovirus group K member 6 Pro protein-like n=1 Tax=Cricetulus griseus TaxID=10029 RepID=A0A9J7GM53_CRIGR|nr:endogenous retrovirus group K member 6 Pro protein-like [Cricetulus griseus]
MTLIIDGRAFQGLLDMGADRSVISLNHCPKVWPLQESDSSMKCVGVAKSPSKSSQLLTCKHDEGHSGMFQPFILPHIPINLWVRDVLEAMGAIQAMPHVQHILREQGYCPGKGIGQKLQGVPLPMLDKPPGAEGSGRPERIGTFLMGAIVSQPRIPPILIT